MQDQEASAGTVSTSDAHGLAVLLDRARRCADLNAFITIDESTVLGAARDADRALAAGSTGPPRSVPFAVKDSYLTGGSGRPSA
jgi:Asp-tRNA(Asn)/Glu-tRNA(Gln) amidotransferase A subunit family amidase